VGILRADRPRTPAIDHPTGSSGDQFQSGMYTHTHTHTHTHIPNKHVLPGLVVVVVLQHTHTLGRGMVGVLACDARVLLRVLDCEHLDLRTRLPSLSRVYGHAEFHCLAYIDTYHRRCHWYVCVLIQMHICSRHDGLAIGRQPHVSNGRIRRNDDNTNSGIPLVLVGVPAVLHLCRLQVHEILESNRTFIRSEGSRRWTLLNKTTFQEFIIDSISKTRISELFYLFLCLFHTHRQHLLLQKTLFNDILLKCNRLK
jgi:hypothetical protein